MSVVFFIEFEGGEEEGLTFFAVNVIEIICRVFHSAFAYIAIVPTSN